MELILMRQLASALALPVLIADADGDLLFLNEPAELLLGRRLDELGDLSLEERRRIFRFRDGDPGSTNEAEPPLEVALRERRPVHRWVRLRGFDGVDRTIEVTSFPMVAAGGHVVGAVAMFWERRAR
jgi:PAS domain-containing protein